MTDKELKRLNRRELLEIMLELRKQLDEARRENEELRSKLSGADESLMADMAKKVSALYDDRFGENAEKTADGGKA
ncbi:MAG: hypothetical protein ACI4JW_00420 [Oscillospiraceae bacterium]